MIFDCRRAIGSQPHKQNPCYGIPDFSGKRLPQNRKEPNQHNAVEQQVRHTVQPCAEIAGRSCFPGEPSVQCVRQAGEGIDHKESQGTRWKEDQAKGTNHTGRCHGIRDIPFVRFFQIRLHGFSSP